MHRFLRHMMCSALVFVTMLLLTVSASAYDYPQMPSNWEDVTVTVGDVTMPFSRYLPGTIYSGEKRYMTLEEQADYGLNVGADLDLRGWECVGFARYAYAALFYQYPQDASIDSILGIEYSGNYAYRNMILEVMGTKTLSGGYDEETLKTLITACQPGALIRCGGHTMVIMAIFDDGVIVYDNNFAWSDTIDKRAYTWSQFVSSFGSRGIQALQMPAYYPGFTYSAVPGSGGLLWQEGSEADVVAGQAYGDVTDDAWYAAYVYAAVDRGLLSGTGWFRPDEDATRAEMVEILGREYEAETGIQIQDFGISPFTDVAPADAKYITWAYNMGITNGTPDNTFVPDAGLSREQLAVFLYRLARVTGIDVTTDSWLPYRFWDYGDIHDYAWDALGWAVQAGILKGDESGYVNPQRYATRSEMVTMVARYVAYMTEAQASVPALAGSPEPLLIDG